MRLLRAFVLAGFASLGATVGVADDGLIGKWVGTIGDADSTTVFELRRGSDGTWTGTARTVDEDAEPHEVDRLIVTDDGIELGASSLPGAPLFSGRRQGDRIDGSVSLTPPPPPPATDVYLVELHESDTEWKPGTPANLTDRAGYDNQPRFLPDSSALLYTSIRDGQADIYRWDLEEETASRLTETIESEYSPTPLPTGDGFSTVRVEADGTQRLWSFDLAGQEPVLLLEAVAPVGYHGWLDQHRLGLFVLGSPPTLQIADVGLQSSTVVSSNVGRSIHRSPRGDAVTFVNKRSETEWTIDLFEIDTSRLSTLLPTRPGSEDFTWTPGGALIMGEGSTLYVAEPFGDRPQWHRFADFGEREIDGISRLDISDDGRWLAFVAERPGPETAVERTHQPVTLRRWVED